MKKFLSAVIACMMFLCAVGCVSDEEKFEREWNTWIEQNLNYETFTMYHAMHGYFSMEGTQIREWSDFDFVIFSSDNILRESLKMDFHSDEEFFFRSFPRYDTVNIDHPVIKKDDWLYACVAYEWGKQIDSVSCTLHYTTTDGEEVSKDYILDFTQTPFRDYRDK